MVEDVDAGGAVAEKGVEMGEADEDEDEDEDKDKDDELVVNDAETLSDELEADIVVDWDTVVTVMLTPRVPVP